MDARVGQVHELPFWELKTLAEMTPGEWEALCDGCAKCCLEKLEDERTGAISYTNVACRLLDVGTCRCARYEVRRRFVPNCEALTAENVPAFGWLPGSCAYRRLAEGRGLEWWHPLVSGDPSLVHRLGISALGRTVREADAGPLEHHIVDWPA